MHAKQLDLQHNDENRISANQNWFSSFRYEEVEKVKFLKNKFSSYNNNEFCARNNLFLSSDSLFCFRSWSGPSVLRVPIPTQCLISYPIRLLSLLFSSPNAPVLQNKNTDFDSNADTHSTVYISRLLFLSPRKHPKS